MVRRSRRATSSDAGPPSRSERVLQGGTDIMCGICGIVIPDNSPRAIDLAAFTRLRDTIAHRGPDGFGVFMEPGVALGHRRLSIVDVSHGQQPMASADGALQLVYNGEVFNHPTLMAQ